MKSQSKLAQLSLRPYVQQYTFVEMESWDELSHHHKLFTLGEQSLVFILSGSITCQPCEHVPFELPKASVVGPFSCKQTTKVSGPVKAFVVRLNTYGAYRLLGLSMDTVVNYYRDLLKIDFNFWQNICDSISSARSFDEMIRLMDSSLIQKMQYHTCYLKEVDSMIHYMEMQKTVIDWDAMAKYFKTSRHTLERQFMEVTGLTPQMYCRITRFTATMQQVHKLHTPAWRHVLAQNGYSSPSQFVKDFYYFGSNKNILATQKDRKPTMQISFRKIQQVAQSLYPAAAS